ncbi:MDR family MFS transporter [Actinomadura rayongensis]|uniref:DHA2 family efflux MFS transporter permease subunit n=1 Tax=Actinomadura rayongensis TaxID=1429076 RepID=A0A6I4WBK1_9ACTN|nr:MDR family MFS transporter [Actinomadura rayongensis]MXQ65406.1 DHA2 family efflux MFS transporter permease subunit [Actinomadura rayongensis]
MSASSVALPAAPGSVPRNVRWVLLGVMLAMLLAMLDNMVVGTAMPTIVGDLGGLEHISWVVTAYTLVTAVTTPIWGKCGDLFGRKPVYLASVAVFLAGSALCGAAQSMPALIAFRALQGIGAGGIGAGAFALIAALVPPRERGRYQGMTASIMAIGTIGGPLLGGFITGHWGWRWAFYVNVPLGLFALVWLWRALHVPTRLIKAGIDWLGIALLTVTISATVLAATWAGTTYAWGSWQILGLGVVAVLGLGGFVRTERRAAEPVLPPGIFTGHRNFPLAIVLLLAAGVVMFGAGLYLPLFQQTVQDASATNSGLLMLPLMIPVVIVSTIAGKIMSATGRYKVFPILGAAFLAVGLGLLATMGTDTSRILTCTYMVLVGIGLGLTQQMAGTIAQNSVDMRDMGAAMSAVTLFRTLGGSLGVAVFGSLFTRAVQSHLPGTGGGVRTDAHTLDHLSAGAKDAYLHAVTSGTHQIFLTGAILCAVAFIAALCVIETPLRKAPPTGTPAVTGKAPAPTP